MNILNIFKHRKKFFNLSKKYIGKRYKYWNHDLDKLILGNNLHRQISHHHPVDYKYWQFNWIYNNWEEICLDWESKEGAQYIMNRDYKWARKYVKIILEKWGIWKDDHFADESYDYIDFYNYISTHQNNPITWKL